MNYTLCKLTALFLIALAGCSDDGFRRVIDEEADPYTSVTLSLELPGSTAPSTRSEAQTRASSDPNALEGELIIKTLDVFAFDPATEKLLFRVEGTDITTDASDDSKKRFSVTLKRGDYNLVLLANARSEVETHYQSVLEADGHTLASVQETLLFETTGKLNFVYGSTGFRPIAMWAMKKNITIDENTNLEGSNAFQMTRMVSRIDVSLSDEAFANFKMTSIYLYNYNRYGHLVPSDGAAWGLDGYVTRPSMPSGKTVTEGPLAYTQAAGEITDSKYSLGRIYTFESVAGTRQGYLKNTCLVIGGTYKGEENHYYRMDFAIPENNSTTYLPLLRNHLYKVSITKVDGPGYRTKEDAFNSLPENIEVDIVKWNATDLSNVEFDSQYYLGLSSLDIGFSGLGGTNELQLKTNCATWKYILSSNADPEGTVTVPSWITITSGHTAGTAYSNSTAGIGLSVDKIPGTASRTAYIHVFAGRFIMTVTITQDPWYISRANISPDNLKTSSGGETYTFTMDGYFDEVPIRIRTSQGEIVEEGVIGTSGSYIPNSSGTLSVPSYWNTEAASKQLFCDYYNKVEDKWEQLLAPEQDAYWVKITTSDPDMNDFTGWGSYMEITIKGNYPSLPVRFANTAGTAAVTTGVQKNLLAKSHDLTGTTYRVYVPYNDEGNPTNRTIHFQYWDGTYNQSNQEVWIPTFSISQRQGNIVLPEYSWPQYNENTMAPTGNSLGTSPARNRVLAHQDYDHLIGENGYEKNWYRAMGIKEPDGMNNSISPKPDLAPGRQMGNAADKYLVSDYTAEVTTGCGAYYERDFGPLNWKLPTLLEGNQIKYMHKELQRPAGFSTVDDPHKGQYSSIYVSSELSDYYFFDDFGPTSFGSMVYQGIISHIYSGPPFNFTQNPYGGQNAEDVVVTTSLIVKVNAGVGKYMDNDDYYMYYYRKNGSDSRNDTHGYVNCRCVRNWNPNTDIGGPGYVPVFNW